MDNAEMIGTVAAQMDKTAFGHPSKELTALSTKRGGLDIWSTEHHSLATCLASQASCRKHYVKVDPDYVRDPSDTHSEATI